MGQQQLQRHVCCMGKEHNDFYDAASEVPPPQLSSRGKLAHDSPAAPDVRQPEATRDHDIICLRHGLTSLQQVVGDMQGEILRLRAENGHLQLSHSEVTQENSTLRETIEDQQSQRDWDKLDVIEEYYRQLEQHRRDRELPPEIYAPVSYHPADADEAGGSPMCIGGQQKSVPPCWPVKKEPSTLRHFELRG